VDAPDLIRGLFRHMEWADALVFGAVLGSERARTDRVVRDRLHHAHLVQRAFLHVWKGLSFEVGEGEALDLVGLARWARAYHEAVAPHLDALDPESLDRIVVLPWAERLTARVGRAPAPVTEGEMLLQVAAHSTYHRGQANARLRQIGAEPPLCDFIAWVWYGKPRADWPA
jgi:uncharacterized damage-inducible protein DinB